MFYLLRIGLLNNPTGFPKKILGDAVAVAKKDLSTSEILDGEGGYSVYGKLLPASDSIKIGALPIGLANRIKLKNSIKKDNIIRWTDVIYNKDDFVTNLRLTMERTFLDDKK